MSLDKIASRKRKIDKPEQEKTPEPLDEAPDRAGVSRPIGTPAVIPDDKLEGIKQIFEQMKDGGATKGFSMDQVLSMDSESVGMPTVLSIPIGGTEHDMFRNIERTRLTNYQKGLYCDAIHVAEHGIGWRETFPNGETIDLDFPVTIMADAVVKRMRAAGSVDGQSLEVFERTMSNWTRYLYEKDQQAQQQSRRGIQQ